MNYSDSRRLPRCSFSGKICHPNFGSAVVHMRSLSCEYGAKRLHVYRCPHCGGDFHVGHIARRQWRAA